MTSKSFLKFHCYPTVPSRIKTKRRLLDQLGRSSSKKYNKKKPSKAVGNLSSHPIKAFYKDVVLITINTDNRTVSNTTMTDEVRKVVEECNLSREDHFESYKVSVEHSFASESVKQKRLKYVE